MGRCPSLCSAGPRNQSGPRNVHAYARVFLGMGLQCTRGGRKGLWGACCRMGGPRSKRGPPP
eukprot:2898541-Pyramimonas_sp.AAC.1